VRPEQKDLLRGYIYVLIAVTGFGGTFIAVSLGLQSFDPITMSMGRVIPAGIGAIIALLLMKAPLLPPRDAFPQILGVTAGVVIGFPLLTSHALTAVPAGDAGVIGALAPMATGVLAIILGYKKPKPMFWAAAAVGSGAAMVLAVLRNNADLGGGATWGYLALVGAMFAGAGGHIAGNKLAGRYNSFQVLCWAVIVSTPIQLPIALINISINPITEMPTAASIGGYIYASLFSVLIGNFLLNLGNYKIGLIKGAQLSLINPIVTLILSVVILHQSVNGSTWLAAAVIIGAVAWSQRIR
jgi:drug/metabolite transporter (DMT)-like permease